MGLTALERYTFDVRGYLKFDDVLGRSEVKTLRKAIGDQRLPRPGAGVMEQRFGFDSELLGWHQSLRDLIDHPLVVEVLADLIGPYARLDHAYGIMMRKGQSGLGLHGPSFPWDASQFYVHRHGRMWNGLLSFSWALTSAVPGEGGFGCIPGSHRAEEPVPEGAETLVVEVPQPAGSLLVFTEALAHCTVPWQGSEDRYCLLYKYSPGNSTWSRHPAAPGEVVDLMTPAQRRLVEPPYVGGRSTAIE